jgi:hypothetical protein
MVTTHGGFLLGYGETFFVLFARLTCKDFAGSRSAGHSALDDSNLYKPGRQ